VSSNGEEGDKITSIETDHQPRAFMQIIEKIGGRWTLKIGGGKSRRYRGGERALT